MARKPLSASRARASTSRFSPELSFKHIESLAAADAKQRGRPRQSPGAPVHRRPCGEITFAEATEFVAALHYASQVGMEPNVFATVQWAHAGSDRAIPDRIRRLLKYFAIWVRRRAHVPPVWAYAREVATLKIEHLHLVVFLPTGLLSEFRRRLAGWIALETSGEVGRCAIHIEPITAGDLGADLRSYLLKEGCESVLQRWVRPRHAAKATGGLISGKRVKVSHAIGRAARNAAWRADFTERRAFRT